MSRATVRPKGQVTLPTEVRRALHVEVGDDVAFDVDPDSGVVTVRGLVSVPADQTWFWSREWQDGEREASQQLSRGEGTVYEDGDAFLASLDDS